MTKVTDESFERLMDQRHGPWNQIIGVLRPLDINRGISQKELEDRAVLQFMKLSWWEIREQVAKVASLSEAEQLEKCHDVIHGVMEDVVPVHVWDRFKKEFPNLTIEDEEDTDYDLMVAGVLAAAKDAEQRKQLGEKP